MAYCTKCGSAINDGVAFCPACGQATGASAVPPPPNHQPLPNYEPPPNYQQPPQYPGYAAPPVTTGIQENVASLLCYLGWWVTGIIFLVIDKRPLVRFHAAQSIVMFGALTVFRIVLGIVFSGSWYYGLGVLYLLIFSVFNLLWFVAWVVLMVMAYQGKKLEIPVISNLARSLVGKV